MERVGGLLFYPRSIGDPNMARPKTNPITTHNGVTFVAQSPRLGIRGGKDRLPDVYDRQFVVHIYPCFNGSESMTVSNGLGIRIPISVSTSGETPLHDRDAIADKIAQALGVALEDPRCHSLGGELETTQERAARDAKKAAYKNR